MALKVCRLILLQRFAHTATQQNEVFYAMLSQSASPITDDESAVVCQRLKSVAC